KFLVARRLMYWQAYLHKTSLCAELILTKALRRARELLQKGTPVSASAPLLFFMQHKIGADDFTPEVLSRFAELDDVDIMSAIKAWQSHPDAVLSALSKMIVNRDLLKVRLSNEKFSKQDVAFWKEKL